jgi:hypothetical protein
MWKSEKVEKGKNWVGLLENLGRVVDDDSGVPRPCSINKKIKAIYDYWNKQKIIVHSVKGLNWIAHKKVMELCIDLYGVEYKQF